MGRRQLKQGDAVVGELYQVLADHSFSSLGSEAQWQLATLLTEQGFSVEREVQVPGYRRTHPGAETPGRLGRIDLLAVRGTTRLGIEIDSWRTPKTKSIEKLLAFTDLTHRVALLNHAPGLWGTRVSLPAGVSRLRSNLDLVLHLDVLAPSDPDRVSGRAANAREIEGEFRQ